MLARALSKLSVREKEIMRLRFGLGGCAEKTQKQVADIMGISQSYISRLEKEDSLAAAKGYDADDWMRKSQHQKQAFL